MELKSAANELAIMGGHPAFHQPVHVGRPSIRNREGLQQRIDDMLDRQWLSNHGPLVQEFERAVQDLLGVRHCVVTCNGTLALEVAIRALGMKGEVIVPSFTFIATVHALQWQEITPIFCDIDPHTHNLDPTCVKRLLTPNTTGIVGVHTWGRPCQTDALADIARENGLRLLFDASHAFACSHGGQMIGRFGDAEVFSFHATKFVNTFEGGAIVTDNDDLAEKVRLMTNFGFSGPDKVIYLGTNAKMSEVCAAMGLSQLESLDEAIATNQRNYALYCEGLDGIPGVKLIAYDKNERNNFQYIVVEVDIESARLTRDMFLQVFHAENILARRYFYPGCHRMEPYRSYYPNAGQLLPQTERLCEEVLVLPTGATCSPDDIRKICAVMRLASDAAGDVRVALRDCGKLPEFTPSGS